MTDPMRVPLQEWLSTRAVDEALRWKDAASEQGFFFRDVVAPLVGSGLPYRRARDHIAFVVSTHRSKSVVLPVVRFERPDLGVYFVLRDNFYNYKLSVCSDRPIVDEVFPYLFHTTPPVEPEYTGDSLRSCYFEGFPEEDVFGYHSADPRRWSCELHGRSPLWMTLHTCMRHLGAVAPRTWHTRASHRAELDARSAAEKAEREAERVAEPKEKR